ncbi:Uncharacterised protein [Mycobacteroides abscessus subsp. bolletii]|nr:Uncharacterised protein [Mycobacteroides abscessus subsp. bolletii]SKF73432.1 Uncharacterised protein [Mycobacteroides abscessus subsp. bolletii]SKH74434.1 Uncharacterised protein [Mycobacteroides abscessus subsp. bolletii]SKH93569.1 Uncharacterised protein [Mycobacteroides abscessus subsp. bolletii]SKH97841.1 Uncharacterised protein [Mycobacteroides abscessus subsp. bolletii]
MVGRRRPSGRPQSQNIREVVEKVLNVPGAVLTVTDAALAWAVKRGRPITVENHALPSGVFGQWLALPERDLIQVHSDLPAQDRTIAHELGHIVLGHRGQPVSDYAATYLTTVPQSLAAYILQRSCVHSGDDQWPADEIAAERFATILLRRIQAQGHDPAFKLDEALG